MRIGHGYDVHRLVSGRALILGGVTIPYEKGLDGHSDADVLVHAVMDALLGAAAMGDTEAAGAALARLEALWQADQAYLHIVVSHEDIHDAEALLQRAALLCGIGNDELRPALAELRSAMSMVAETQQISAKNIL